METETTKSLALVKNLANDIIQHYSGSDNGSNNLVPQKLEQFLDLTTYSNKRNINIFQIQQVNVNVVVFARLILEKIEELEKRSFIEDFINGCLNEGQGLNDILDFIRDLVIDIAVERSHTRTVTELAMILKTARTLPDYAGAFSRAGRKKRRLDDGWKNRQKKEVAKNVRERIKNESGDPKGGSVEVS